MFAGLKATPLNTLIGAFLLSGLVGFWLVSAIESTRQTSGLFYRWFGLLTLFAHIFGISVAAPLLWIPSYLWSKNKRLGSLNSWQLWAILLTLGAITAISYQLVYGPESDVQFAFLVVAFHLFSIFMQFIWVLVGYWAAEPETKQGFMSGSQTAQSIYTICTAIMGIWWISIFSAYLRPYTMAHGLEGVVHFGQSLLDLFSSTDPIDQFGVFFLLDAIFMWLTYLVWLLMEEGLLTCLGTVCWTFVIGPGAAITRSAVIREERLFIESNLAKTKRE